MASMTVYRVAWVVSTYLLLLTSASEIDQEGGRTSISRAHVETSLVKVLVGYVAGERSAKVDEALRPIYDSLPKNEHGNLGHQEASDAVFRLFLQRHGLVVKGFKSDDAEEKSTSVVVPVEDWVPRYLQEQVEKRVNGRGLTFLEVSVMVVTLEKLIQEHAPKEELLPQESWLPTAEDVLLFVAAAVVVLGLYRVSAFVRNAEKHEAETDGEAEPSKPSASGSADFNWVFAFFGFGSVSVFFNLLDVTVFVGVLLTASAMLAWTRLMPEPRAVAKKGD